MNEYIFTCIHLFQSCTVYGFLEINCSYKLLGLKLLQLKVQTYFFFHQNYTSLYSLTNSI